MSTIRRADTTSTNPNLLSTRHVAAFAHATRAADRDAKGSSKASIPMATNRSATRSRLSQKSSPLVDSTEGCGGEPLPSGGGDEQSLQIPNDPLDDNTIWDWNTPLDSVGKSSSYYYEPQGELLQDRQRERFTRNVSSVTQAVSDVGLPSQFPHSDLGVDDHSALPTANLATDVLGPSAGSKRKAGTEDQSTPKRPFRTMSDLASEPDDTVENQPPTYSTRSRSSLLARTQSDTGSSASIPLFPATNPQTTGPETSGVPRQSLSSTSRPAILPARKVFPIQIGDKLFRLSGASISSDGM